MSDPVLAETAGLRAWRVTVQRGTAPSFMETVLGPAGEAGIDVMVARGDMIFGVDHVRSALYHAKRAFEHGTNASDSIAMETLLYASGERQLSSAIKKMAVDGTTVEVVVAQLSEGSLETGGWRELEESLGPEQTDRLKRFGISKPELDSVSAERAVDLVLEKVASVDVTKK
jgi:KEOPS complex subunit Cgi121